MRRLLQFNNFFDNNLLYFEANSEMPLKGKMLASIKLLPFETETSNFCCKTSHVIYYTLMKDTMESIYVLAVAFVLMIIRVRCSTTIFHKFLENVYEHQEQFALTKQLKNTTRTSLASQNMKIKIQQIPTSFLISRHATRNIKQISNHNHF